MSPVNRLLQAAERYLLENDPDRAAECFDRAFGMDNWRTPAPALGMARVAILLNRLDEATKILDVVDRRFPRHSPTLTARGVVAERRGELESAVHLYDLAIKAGPVYAPAYFNLGRVLGQLKLFNESKRAIERATALEPRYDYFYALGTAAFLAKDLPAAIRALDECLRLDPAQLDAYATLADVLAEAGSGQLADDLLANALKRFPTAAVLYSKRAAVAMLRGDYETAHRHAAKVAELDSKNEEAHLTEAMLHSSVLDFEAAEKAARRAIAINPKSWRAHFQLGALDEARGRRANAKAAYQKAIAAGASGWKPLNNLANLLMEDGAVREAKPLLEQACAVGPQAETFTCRYNLAIAHWMLGDKAASKQAALDAVKLGPEGHATVENARRFLGNFA